MLLALILYVTGLGTGLLWLRQERLHAMHAVAVLHNQINRSRHGLWDLQVRIADLAGPRQLSKAIERAHLHLQPVASQVETSQPMLSSAGTRHEGY